MLKAVIDTNIWISGLMKSPLSRPVIEAFIKGKFTPVISDALLKEPNDTLNEPRVAKLISSDEAKELIALIAEKSQRVNPTAKINACRDPEDNFILSLALHTKSCLVSLDKDLFALSKEFDIILPKAFLRRIK